MKFNLLLSESDLNSFCSDWFIPFLSKYFNVIWHHDNQKTSPKDTLVVTGYTPMDEWYKNYAAAGYKVIKDDLWDQYVDNSVSKVKNNQLLLRNKNWIWYNESLWWQHLKYHKYTQSGEKSKYFLLLMNKPRDHRDYIYEHLTEYLNNAIYSYIAKGLQIFDDIPVGHGDWQRHMMPRWFDETVFSVVAESMMDASHAPTDNVGEVFVSEKTFKPIAFKHPFIIAGTAGLLKYLKDQGFATFEHVIDESYDSEDNHYVRLEKVVVEVKRLIRDQEQFQDIKSLEIKEHNFNLFYNTALIEKNLTNTLIKDILDYAET